MKVLKKTACNYSFLVENINEDREVLVKPLNTDDSYVYQKDMFFKCETYETGLFYIIRDNCCEKFNFITNEGKKISRTIPIVKGNKAVVVEDGIVIKTGNIYNTYFSKYYFLANDGKVIQADSKRQLLKEYNEYRQNEEILAN